MSTASPAQMVDELLGCVHAFSTAVRDVLEEDLLQVVARGRLRVTQLKVLKLVALTQAHTIGDVAAFLGVSNTAASKAVDKLVRRRLLRRTEGHTDRRESELSLSVEGRRLLERYDSIKDQKLARLLEACTPEQLCTAVQTVDSLTANMIHARARREDYCLRCGIYFRERCFLPESTRRACFYQQYKAPKDPAVGAAPGEPAS